MKRHTLLVPLDGSRSAETALPYAVTLARACGLAIELLAVVGPLLDSHHADRLQSLMMEGLHVHLRLIAEDLRAGGLAVEMAVRRGDPAEEILVHAERLRSRAVVMTTHGLGGLRLPLLGGVTDKVMRLVPCPVLLVRPDERVNPRLVNWRPRRLLVPLDGSPAAEEALPQAYELAAALDAEVVLARVQPWTAAQLGAYRGYISDVAHMDEEAAHAAADYLRARRLCAPAGLTVQEVVLRGDPAEQLIDFAQTAAVDLVVMTTHGHGSLRGLVLGSVTDRLARQGLPTMIVRPVTADVDAEACRRAIAALA